MDFFTFVWFEDQALACLFISSWNCVNNFSVLCSNFTRHITLTFSVSATLELVKSAQPLRALLGLHGVFLVEIVQDFWFELYCVKKTNGMEILGLNFLNWGYKNCILNILLKEQSVLDISLGIKISYFLLKLVPLILDRLPWAISCGRCNIRV